METETENQSVFVDLDFPADDSSVFCDYTTPLSNKQTNIFPMSKDEDFI